MSVGDFAKCKTSNIKTGKSGYTATRYYNRLVIAASSEPVTVDGLDATKKYGYIDLAIDDSNTIEYPYTDSDGNSQTAKLVCTNSIDGEDVPQAQDDIVQWGNAFANETQYTKGTFKSRGNVLLMSVSEGGLLTYTQIDQPVDGSAMAQYMTDCILPTMVRFSSDHFIIAPYAQRDAADTVICFRDDWNDKMVCGHNDVVRHSDKLWQCIVNVGETTNDYDEAYREPKLTSPIWKIYVKGIPSAGKPVLTIEDGVVRILGKARGSRNGNNMLTEFAEKLGGIDFGRPFCFGYTGFSDEMLKKYIHDSARLYEDKIDVNDPGNFRIHKVGATIGTYAGPGAIAVAFFAAKK